MKQIYFDLANLLNIVNIRFWGFYFDLKVSEIWLYHCIGYHGSTFFLRQIVAPSPDLEKQGFLAVFLSGI
jgi:hypothetical protein